MDVELTLPIKKGINACIFIFNLCLAYILTFSMALLRYSQHLLSTYIIDIQEITVPDVQTAVTDDWVCPTLTLAAFGNLK